MKANLHYQSVRPEPKKVTNTDLLKALGYIVALFIFLTFPFMFGLVEYLLNCLK